MKTPPTEYGTGSAPRPQQAATDLPDAATRRPSVDIMGLPISISSHTQVLQRIGDVIARREKRHYISVTNTESMYQGLRDEKHAKHIRDADFSLCDGVGVIVAGWAWGHRIGRYTGPTLQLEAIDHGRAHQWRHFFYGGKEGVAEELARRLTEKFPGLIVCGTHCPPFRESGVAEDQGVIDAINATRPDIVWVGLGLPKQERWIQDHLHHIDAPWMVGVGAAFDYHAGTVPWAPPLIRAIGMEWLFTFALQPRLRARRYGRSLLFVLEMIGRGLLSMRVLGLLRKALPR